MRVLFQSNLKQYNEWDHPFYRSRLCCNRRSANISMLNRGCEKATCKRMTLKIYCVYVPTPVATYKRLGEDWMPDQGGKG